MDPTDSMSFPPKRVEGVCPILGSFKGCPYHQNIYICLWIIRAIVGLEAAVDGEHCHFTEYQESYKENI